MRDRLALPRTRVKLGRTRGVPPALDCVGLHPVLQLQQLVGNRSVAQRLTPRPKAGDSIISIMRGPFDAEDPDHRTRRLAVIRAARIAVERLKNALSRGYIWKFERVTSGGVTPIHTAVEETLANRETRLRQLISDLIGMTRTLESAPIPASWFASEVRDSAGSLDASSEVSATWTDTMMFYAHYGVGVGRSTDLSFINISYVNIAPVATRAISRRVALSRGVNTGVYIQVPDPENAPMEYVRITGYERLRRSGVILDVWSDDFGYYYIYGGAKHYLPGRP